MPITGRGDFDFNSTWLGRGRGRGRGRGNFQLLYRPLVSANENTDIDNIWNDWFFEASATYTPENLTSSFGELESVQRRKIRVVSYG